MCIGDSDFAADEVRVSNLSDDAYFLLPTTIHFLPPTDFLQFFSRSRFSAVLFSIGGGARVDWAADRAVGTAR